MKLRALETMQCKSFIENIMSILLKQYTTRVCSIPDTASSPLGPQKLYNMFIIISSTKKISLFYF